MVWRGDRDAGEFAVFYMKDGKVAGALTVERSEELAHARTLLAEGVDVGGDEAKALLGDPDSDLASSSPQARLPGSIAGWCNWQHVRLWSANSGFKSLARS